MNYDEFETIMEKLNNCSLSLDFYSDYFSQDFYEESGIYWVLDNTVDLLSLFFRNSDNNLRDELFDCLSVYGDEFDSRVANIYDKLQESNKDVCLTQDEFCKQIDKLYVCLKKIDNFKVYFGDNGNFVDEINILIELNLDLLIRLMNDEEEVLYNIVSNYKEYEFTKNELIDIYNELMED